MLLIVSCYSASVANFFTATSARLLMNGITFDKPEAQNDMGKTVSATPSDSFVISKGGASELFTFNNFLKVNTKCRKVDKTCKHVKGYNADYVGTSDIDIARQVFFDDDYVGKSDIDIARQVFLDKDVTAWIEDENQFEYYLFVLNE